MMPSTQRTVCRRRRSGSILPGFHDESGSISGRGEIVLVINTPPALNTA
jgi:hypothetical protein